MKEKMKPQFPKFQIGVMGGAFVYSLEAIKAAYNVGKTIAQNDCTLITGATTGIPYAATLGASSNRGLTIGISPGKDAKEHVERFGKPLEGLSAVIYTGMGFNGREPINISSCDGVIYIGGEFGTLIEFGQGFYDGKVLGVLTGVRGISDSIKEIVAKMSSCYGSEIIYDSDPERLAERVIEVVKEKQTPVEHDSKDQEGIKKILGAVENE